jgi:hypothetical protein
VGGYNCTFPTMVDSWRSSWSEGTSGETDPSFPFGFVQLNSFTNGSVYDNPSGAGNLSSPFAPGFAGLRWSQTSGHGYVPNAAQPNTYMAVAFDTPDSPIPTPINGVPGADPGFGVHSPYVPPEHPYRCRPICSGTPRTTHLPLTCPRFESTRVRNRGLPDPLRRCVTYFTRRMPTP